MNRGEHHILYAIVVESRCVRDHLIERRLPSYTGSMPLANEVGLSRPTRFDLFFDEAHWYS